MRKLGLLIFGLQLWASNTYSQNNEELRPRKWGLETEIFQPFYPTVNIVRIQATHTLFYANSITKGDLIFGAYLRPNVKHDVVEKINEYMIAVGYRHFFWKGLHLEVKSNMGYAYGTKNLQDNKDYETVTWFWETGLGYKFNILKTPFGTLYLMPQIGGLGKIIADIGPRNGKTDTFVTGNIYLGINF